MGPPAEQDDYVCTLSPGAVEQAKRELREDASSRQNALRHMREWIAKHPHIRNCRTDAVFLLRFLRTRKFSIPQAQQMLERYLAMRETHTHWFRNLDVNDKAVQDIIDAGYIIPLPERDSEGRQVILTCIGVLDPHKFTGAEVVRAHSVVTEVLMDDEETQVRGVVHVVDEIGLTMSHISMFTVSDIRVLMRSIQKTLPMRLKGSHFINLPGCAKQMFELFFSLHNDKLRKRLRVHGDMDSLLSCVDVNLLPKEYGGKIHRDEMIAQFKAKMMSRAALIRSLDTMRIHLPPGSKLMTEVGGDQDSGLGISGSFRKLELD